ncbi:uL15 family ribosomal protein [Candidatus Woesearchaeota archaeon]|nr:uL15 family ribosomal protein [Candidatus Woesearchaeota archaeon]
MRRKIKKSKGFRGYKTHGWGSRKKHRGSGNRGGFGLAGTGKRADQRKSWVLRNYGNDYFGKHGFVRHAGKFTAKEEVINVGDLERFNENEIDLEKKGYGKLLGRGKLSRKIKVIAKSASGSAIEKIRKAGGEVTLKE